MLGLLLSMNEIVKEEKNVVGEKEGRRRRKFRRALHSEEDM